MKKIVFLLAMLSVAMTSCLKDEAYVAPPKVAIIAPTVMPDADVVIAANITPEDADAKIVSVSITYTVNGVSTSGEMTLDVAPKYVYTIPAKVNTDGTVVKYVITVKASNDKMTFKEGSYMVSDIDYSGLILNEIDGNNKFIELYNSSNQELPLNGVIVDRNNGDSKWTGTSADKIPANSYRLIAYTKDGIPAMCSANDGTTNPPTGNGTWMQWSVDGGLSAGQTIRIALYFRSTLLNVFMRGESPWGNKTGVTQDANNSYSRMSDGTWKYATPTPGTANGASEADILTPGFSTAD